MSVVGFDVGSKTCFIGIAKQGGIETVANEYSQRSTPAMVSFGEDQRYMGTNAQQKLITNLKNTAWLFKHLIGRPYDDVLVKKYQEFISYDLVEIPETKRCGMKVSHCGKDYTFSMEQILAMLLGKLKNIAEKGLEGRPVSDCVVTCPFYLTNAERCAWLEACKIAGLNCLRLFNETTATALAYGIFKTDLPEAGKDPRRVAFVDMGYTQTQVSIAQFNKGQLVVRAMDGDRNLGGLDFDRLLVDHFAAEFKPKYKIDIKSKKRAELRLLNECEKLKKQMSANKTPVQLNVECIMDDKDVSGKMKREEFEALCKEAGFVDRFKQVLQNCKAQLKEGEQIDAVEMVGGSSRVPWVKETIEEIFGQAPQTTMNADEAVARGAALQCAMLSPTFRVREFEVKDAQPHQIRIDWLGSDGKPGNALLFEENENVPLSKVLTFTRKDISDFTIRASYQKDNFSFFPDKHIGDFVVKGLKPPSIVEEDKPSSLKIKVKLRIDNNGQLIVPQSVQIDKQLVEVQEEEKPKAEEPAAPATEEKAKDEAETKPEEKANGDAPMEDAAPAEAPKVKQQIKSIKLELNIDQKLVGSLSAAKLDQYCTEEFDLAIIDRKERERQDAKNQVEEYVYGNREKLATRYSEYATDSEKDTVNAELQKTEDWLYEEGYDENKQAYVNKYTELQSMMKNIELRYNESQNRASVVDTLGKKLMSIGKFLEKWEQKDDSVAHIEADEIKKVSKCLGEVREWYNKSLVTVNTTPKNVNPAVMSAEFSTRYQTLVSACDKIMDTPKPKPPPVEEPPKDAKKDESASSKTDETPAGDSPKENTPSTEQPTNEQTTPPAPMDVD